MNNTVDQAKLTDTDVSVHNIYLAIDAAPETSSRAVHEQTMSVMVDRFVRTFGD